MFYVGNQYGSLKKGKVRYVLRTEDIAKLFGVKVDTVRKWFCLGKLNEDNIVSLIKLFVSKQTVP